MGKYSYSPSPPRQPSMREHAADEVRDAVQRGRDQGKAKAKAKSRPQQKRPKKKSGWWF